MKTTVEDLERVQKEMDEKEMDEIIASIPSDLLLRFAFVPFVIGALVWEYADTVIDCAIELGDPATKPLSRRIRQMKREYDSLRQGFLTGQHINHEKRNIYLIEDHCKTLFKQLALNASICSKNQRLGACPARVRLGVAAMQCMAVSEGLLRYCEMERRKLTDFFKDRPRARVGMPIPEALQLLPTVMRDFLKEYDLGGFMPFKDRFVKTLATQIALIELYGPGTKLKLVMLLFSSFSGGL